MKNLLISPLLLLSISACKKGNDSVTPFTPGADSKPVVPGDFLTATNYDKLVIEVVYVEGMQPSQVSLDNLKSFLQQHLNKPSGIQINQKSIPSPGKAVFSLNDIKALEQTNRDKSIGNRTLKSYIFFADGDYDQNSGNSKVLGVTYGASSMVIFDKTIRDISGRLGQPSVASVETSVSDHEFGHVLGLVNNGTAMIISHQDEAHGRHCTNTECLMYYSTETSDMIANLTNNNIPQLDANCVNDLKAAGGK